MINHVIKNNLIEAKAVFGLYRANSNGDDIEVYDDNKNTIANFITLRQQKEKGENFFNKALSDYVALCLTSFSLWRRNFSVIIAAILSFPLS